MKRLALALLLPALPALALAPAPGVATPRSSSPSLVSGSPTPKPPPVWQPSPVPVDGSISNGGSSGGGGCKGHAAGYPPGWVFKAVFKYNTGTTAVCDSFLYCPDGSLDGYLGEGDCQILCSQNIG